MQWKDSITDPTLLGSTIEALNEDIVHQDNKQEQEEEEDYNKNRQIEGKRIHSPQVKIFYGDKPFQVGK